jgi:hypothetical protein
MMTQADILGKNEETFTNINLIKDLAEQYDNAVAGTILKNNSNQEGSTSYDMPTSSSQARLTRPSDFDGNDFPQQELTEQSPIKPSKYFADDSALNTAKGLRNIIIGTMIFCVLITFALVIQIIVGPNQVPNRIGIVSQDAVCSEIGAQMVRDGGNSIDAFIASSFCLSVVNPFISGLGA